MSFGSHSENFCGIDGLTGAVQRGLRYAPMHSPGDAAAPLEGVLDEVRFPAVACFDRCRLREPCRAARRCKDVSMGKLGRCELDGSLRPAGNLPAHLHAEHLR